MQIPIFPYDNDRLKTRKVQAMLDELGVLPADHSERPTFLKSHRTAAILIDRALANVAPVVERHCSSRKDLAQATNDKFTSAFLVSSPGGLPRGAVAFADFKAGTYFYGGNALSDFLYEDHGFWGGTFNPDHIVPGVGYQAPQFTIDGPSFAPALAAALTAQGGFTMVADIIAVGTTQGNAFKVLYETNPNFDQELKAIFSTGFSVIGDYNDSIVNLPEPVSGESYRLAITLSATEIAFSLNGGAAYTYAVVDPFLCNFITLQLNGVLWENLVLYPIKSAAQLPALSAL